MCFGPADPDAATYAIDSITGKVVWRFRTHNPAPYTNDIGAGLTVSRAGLKGFSDGVVYFPNKCGSHLPDSPRPAGHTRRSPARSAKVWRICRLSTRTTERSPLPTWPPGRSSGRTQGRVMYSQPTVVNG